MNNNLFDELRISGDLVVDCPGRKIAVFANDGGHVVLLCQEDEVVMAQVVTPEEIGALRAALMRAAMEAQPISDSIDAEFAAHTAIAKAQCGAA